MRTKAVVMAGGSATRLHPVTKALSKHLLPVGRRPMIAYPLGLLESAGFTDIALVVSPEHLQAYQYLLGDGNRSFRIHYLVQHEPCGIAEGISIAEDFLGTDPFALLLGDNIYHGSGMSAILRKVKDTEGGYIFLQRHLTPESYGVACLTSGIIDRIEEKPSAPTSNLIVTGVYLLDHLAITTANALHRSSRGEYEIADVLTTYAKSGLLNYTNLTYVSDCLWQDLGTWEDYDRSQQLSPANTPYLHIL